MILVLQQHNGFPRRAQRKLAMIRRVELAHGNTPIGKAGRRVEHPELESRLEEAAQCGVKIGFLNQALVNCVNERRERMPRPVTAFEIGAGFNGSGCRVGHVRGVVVSGVDVGDGGTVAYDVAAKLPRLAQMVAQKHGIGAGRHSINRVIGAHHGLGVRLGHRGAKSGQVSVLEIVRRDIHVEAVPQRLGAAVHRVVLRS